MPNTRQTLDTLIILAIIGFGFLITVQFLQKQEWIAAVATALSVTFILLLLALLTQLVKRFIEDTDLLLDLIYDQLKNSFINLWYRLPRGFKNKYYRSLIYTFREFETLGLKSKGPFALDLNEVFVPLQVAPESHNNIPKGLIPTKASDQTCRQIWDFLTVRHKEELNGRCIAIIGAPGSGKTTLLQHLTLTYATDRQRRQKRKAPKLIPILLYLRDIQDVIYHQSPSLSVLIEQQESIRQLNPPPHWVENRLKQCLVMLDGLDEVANKNQRQQVSRWINRQIKAYPNTRFIVTARPGGYNEAPIDKVDTVLAIQPFNLKQVEEFIRNWYRQNEVKYSRRNDPGVCEKALRKANHLINRIKNSSSIAELSLNPLLLTMIATVHDYRGALPGRRVELYAEICDVLLGRRQEAKGIPDPMMTAAQKMSVLQVLALRLMQLKKHRFNLTEGDAWIGYKLQKVAGKNVSSADFFNNIDNVSGLLIEKEQGCYEFAHKSFQEYLAAVQLKELNQENYLIENVSDVWWHETIRLYAARSDATKLIRAAFKTKSKSVETLALAVDCVQEGLSVHPDVREKLVNLLDGNCLESSNQKVSYLAASVKLTRRLQNLLRLDNDTEIDPNYITCAEYQLFINERQQIGESRQPTHWKDVRFSHGDATKPITYIRGSDAKEFCEWLNQRYYTLEFCYRLPRQVEIEEHPVRKEPIGCWCQDGETLTVQGITFNQWQAWQETIHNILDGDLKKFYKLIQEFDKALTCAKKLDSSLESVYVKSHECITALKNLEQGRTSSLDNVRDCNRAITKGRHRVQNYGHELNRILDINHAHILSLNLDRSIDFSFILKHAGAISRDLKPIFNLTHTETFDINLFHALGKDITLARKRIDELISEINSIHRFAAELAKILGSINSLTNRLTSVIDLTIAQALKDICKLSHELKQNWEVFRTLDETRLLDNNRNRMHLLDQFINRNCINTNELDFKLISSYCLLIYGFWQLLLYCYKNTPRNQKFTLFSGLGKLNYLVDKYAQKGDKAFELYLFFVWMHERRMNRTPSWGGLRIVKQRIKI